MRLERQQHRKLIKTIFGWHKTKDKCEFLSFGGKKRRHLKRYSGNKSMYVKQENKNR